MDHINFKFGTKIYKEPKKMRKKLILGAVALGILIAVPVIGFAGFAPADRQTYQCITPTNCPGADHVTFNSFTNAPNYGDERAFFDAKDAGITSPGGYQDKLTVKDGQKLVMRVYIHNNANPKAIGDAAATAKNTRMQVLLPTAKNTSLSTAAMVTADNAKPVTISDTVDLAGANPFTVAFDKSAPVQVTYRPNGTGDYVTRNLPSYAFANDQTLNANFGDWKGCFEYSALVTFTVTVKMDKTPPPPVNPEFSCTKLDVAKISRTKYDFTAYAQVKNATIKSYDFVTKNANGTVVDSKTVTTSQLSAKYSFESNTVGTYKVTAVVNTDKGSTPVSEKCSQTIKIETEPTKPVYMCDALTLTKLGGRAVTANVKYTAEGGAKLKSISYDFGDGTTPVLTDKTSIDHTYAKDGTYTTTATLSFQVGKSVKTVRCSAQVSFTTPPPTTPPTTPEQPGKEELPNTGAGDVVGLVAGASAAGTALHYGLAIRRARSED